MTTFKVGDSVVIANAAGIMFGREYFKDGEVTEVMQVEEIQRGDGFEQAIDVRIPEGRAVDGRTDYVDGVPVLYLMPRELVHVIKLKQNHYSKEEK